jgi:hypothetical protein
MLRKESQKFNERRALDLKRGMPLIRLIKISRKEVTGLPLDCFLFGERGDQYRLIYVLLWSKSKSNILIHKILKFPPTCKNAYEKYRFVDL